MTNYPSARTHLPTFLSTKRGLTRKLMVEGLEPRLLLALTVSPSAIEQEMLELINHMRSNPQAELARLINLPATNPATSNDPAVNSALSVTGVDGRELERQFNQLVPAPPLAWADTLNRAAGNYAETVIAAQVQSHNLPPIPSSAQRVINAAGDNSSEWRNFSVSENLFGAGQSVVHTHAAFAIDWAANGIQNPPGHRNALMRSDRTEIGIALVNERVNDRVGVADVTGPLVVVQKIATRQLPDDHPYLLGVAHSDYNGDGRYNAGEALRDVMVTVTGVGGTPTPDSNTTTSVYPSGAYQLRVPPGTYNVLFSGGELQQPRVVTNVEVLSETNQKVDLVQAEPITVPTVRFLSTTEEVTEDSGSISIWPTLSEPTSVDVVVPFSAMNDSTADPGRDYELPSSPIVIPAGEWFAPITINLTNDTVSDPGETVRVVLETPTNATLDSSNIHTLTVQDDDPLPVVEFTETTAVVAESVGRWTVVAELSAPSEREIVIPISLDGAARGRGVDYRVTSTEIVLGAGSLSSSFELAIVDESSPEENENVIVSLGEPTYARLGDARSYQLTVTDNDELGEWTNPNNPLDVTGDGPVVPGDVLAGINELNDRTLIDEFGQLPDRSGNPDALYYDTSGEGILTPLDVLAIINHLNRRGEREGSLPDISPPPETRAQLPQRQSAAPAPVVALLDATNAERRRASSKSRRLKPSLVDAVLIERVDHGEIDSLLTDKVLKDNGLLD